MKVKTVDLKAPGREQLIAESLCQTGFVVLTNTDLPENSINHVYEDWAEFFASKDEKKEEFLFDKEKQTGWFPFKSENAKYSDKSDLKEFFHYYEDADLPLSVCNETQMLFVDLLELGITVLQMIETQLPDEIHDALSEPLGSMTSRNRTLFRILHYPPLNGEEGERSAAHEDINLITLLPAATELGLQVKDNDGNWHAIETNPGDVVVNVGEMLAIATNGYFKATTHRVVNPVGTEAKKSRYSAPLFVHPRSDVLLAPGLSAKEALDKRLEEIGIK